MNKNYIPPPTMLSYPYLLVQKLSSGAYKVLVNGLFVTPDSEDTEVEALLDDARECEAGWWASEREDETYQTLTFQAYTLLNPLSSFLGQTLFALGEQLGPLDDAFFAEKAVYWPPAMSLGSIGTTDGRIIVILRVSGKRKRSETVFDHMKRSKLATTSPSIMAQPSNYEINQRTPSEKILDDRPKPDADIAPVALLYDGFGEFLDIFDGETGIAGLSEVNTLKLHQAVDEFAQRMCLFYNNDDERRTAAIPALNRIFSARTGTVIPSLRAAAIGSLGTYSHNVGVHGAGVLVCDVKNRSAGNNTIAEVELTGHVAHLNASAMERHQDLFERWRVPSLGMTVVGADVRFYAIIAVDHQYRLVNLTPSLSCIPSACDGRDRKALYRAFAAASVLQARILDDAQKFPQVAVLQPEIEPDSRRFPSVTRLRQWGSITGTEYLSFQILGYYPDRQGYRLLYVAEPETTNPDSDGEEKIIIVKFVRQYSIELHAFCAERGFAPRILAFERLPGGWNAIAMEYIDSCDMITKSPELDTHRNRWTRELSQLVQDFHAEGLVHGDLRDANIVCHDRYVMLLDFDWGGRDGQVFYPTPNLNSELLEGRSSNDLRITKEDDNRVLKKTLAKLTQ